MRREPGSKPSQPGRAGVNGGPRVGDVRGTRSTWSGGRHVRLQRRRGARAGVGWYRARLCAARLPSRLVLRTWRTRGRATPPMEGQLYTKWRGPPRAKAVLSPSCAAPPRAPARELSMWARAPLTESTFEALLHCTPMQGHQPTCSVVARRRDRCSSSRAVLYSRPEVSSSMVSGYRARVWLLV